MPTDTELRPPATAMVRAYDKERYSIIAGVRYTTPSLEERLAAANHTIAENQAGLDERDELRARNARLAKWRLVLAITSLALFAACWIQWRIGQ